MPDYIQITFSDLQPEQKDILIAQLSDAGFEGFEETEDVLKAFIKSKEFDKLLLEEITFKYQLKYRESAIKNTNWNQVWETNFQPIVIDDFVSIRADFHEPIKNVDFEIIITPKMSFGTGHHATTHMMIEQMREIDFKEKLVFDFGTGTGILAILAEKLGAREVMTVDNDDWSIENAEENFIRNNSSKIKIQKISTASLKMNFDIILANINKNVIRDNFPALVNQLKKPGLLLLSGLLEEDFEEINSIASDFNLKMKKKLIRNNWVCIKFEN